MVDRRNLYRAHLQYLSTVFFLKDFKSGSTDFQKTGLFFLSVELSLEQDVIKPREIEDSRTVGLRLKKNSTFYMGIHSELDTYHGRVTQYLRNEVRHSVCYEMRQCAPDFQFRGVNTAESRRHFRVRTYTTWRQFLLASTADARGWRQGRRQLVASVEISVL